MKPIRKIALGFVVAAPLVAGGFMAQDRATQDGGRLLGQVLDLVQSRFVDSIDEAMLYEKAARGLVGQLQDPYSELFSPHQLTQFNTTTGGRYGGLGMQIEDQRERGTVVAKVFHNTPAEAAGVTEGDIIIGIDTLSTRGWSNARVADSLRGTPGSKVSVTFARPGVTEPIKNVFTRAIVRVPAVAYAITFDGIGYLPLDNFNESSTRDISSAVRKFQSEGAKGLILDLRRNPGGYLDQALSISNLFLPQGVEIASVRGRGAEPQVYNAREKPIAAEMPIVILIDQYSASAAEIVAGALQDHDRALILGQTSFGKGLVQTMYNLDGGYALKMTTGKWFTPSGRSIQKERKLLPDGQYVEVHPDSLESDSARRARPTYKSTAGRLLYGGGAITPDILVKPDTFTTPEQAFLRATATRSQDMYIAVYLLAQDLKDKVRIDFQVQPAWREDLYARLKQKGVTVDRALYDGASRYIDREIERRVARLAFGDSALRRRTLPDDPQLQRAIDILKKNPSTRELIALATSQARK
ncbi:MAG: S41 family peptidase [Gemmatimonadaceae bacterium]|nr:S41 family peptidase [Gemmatimonadaceae bacterium]